MASVITCPYQDCKRFPVSSDGICPSCKRSVAEELRRNEKERRRQRSKKTYIYRCQVCNKNNAVVTFDDTQINEHRCINCGHLSSEFCFSHKNPDSLKAYLKNECPSCEEARKKAEEVRKKDEEERKKEFEWRVRSSEIADAVEARRRLNKSIEDEEFRQYIRRQTDL